MLTRSSVLIMVIGCAAAAGMRQHRSDLGEDRARAIRPIRDRLKFRWRF
jgi:hypothetical protein